MGNLSGHSPGRASISDEGATPRVYMLNEESHMHKSYGGQELMQTEKE